jgi:hypothetical protein
MKERYGTRSRYDDMIVVTPSHLLTPGEMSDLIEGTLSDAIECGVNVSEYIGGIREH